MLKGFPEDGKKKGVVVKPMYFIISFGIDKKKAHRRVFRPRKRRTFIIAQDSKRLSQ